MKILISSHRFAPSIGGIETVSRLLADEFSKAGHAVRVVTQSAGEANVNFPVLRCPSPAELIRAVLWSDVFFQNNISLRTLWPALVVRRQVVVTHQTWMTHPGESVTIAAKLKLLALRRVRSVAISQAVARQLPVAAVVIGNPYDDETFVNLGAAARDVDLIYVGRLVSDKGVDLLLEALSILHASGTAARLSIVGDGPDRAALQAKTRELELDDTVEFVGAQTGAELARTLNRHRILVVPSRWPEPFGIVALEAIACGCVVVGSDQGGLPEAIGPCGVTFPNNNIPALARTLGELLANPQRRAQLLAQAPAHLARFSRAAIARAYLDVFESLR